MSDGTGDDPQGLFPQTVHIEPGPLHVNVAALVEEYERMEAENQKLQREVDMLRNSTSSNVLDLEMRLKESEAENQKLRKCMTELKKSHQVMLFSGTHRSCHCSACTTIAEILEEVIDE